MNKLIVLLSLLIVSATAAYASSISLPDTSTYYYWVRGAGGSVVGAPRRTSGVGSIKLPKLEQSSGTLFILDPHTGGIASVPLSITGATLVTVDQFQVPTSQQSDGSTAIAPEVSQYTKPSTDKQQSNGSSIVTTILGLLVLGGVIWFVRKLYLSRGQLLLDAARKVGVDVPNPADPIPAMVTTEGKYEPPPAPKVQRIPDEAFTSATKLQSSSLGYLITADGASHAIGKRRVTIGRDSDNDIVLVDSSVSRHHASVEPSENGGVQLIDNGSANGIFVNGERVQAIELQPGSRLNIGHVPLRFEK